MTNRSDGIPLDTADPSANDRWGTAANLPGKSFSKRNLPTKVAENYTDDAGNRILQGDLERQHNIPIELYNGEEPSGLLRELGRTTLDGVRLFHPNDFKINGLALPTNPDDARLLDSAMHNGFDAQHSQYNEFVRERIAEIERDFEDKLTELDNENSTPQQMVEARRTALVEAAKDVRGLQEWLKDQHVGKTGHDGEHVKMNNNDPKGSNLTATMEQIRRTPEYELGERGGLLEEIRPNDFRVQADTGGFNQTAEARAEILLRRDILAADGLDEAAKVTALNSADFVAARDELASQIRAAEVSRPTPIRSVIDLVSSTDPALRESSLVRILDSLDNISPQLIDGLRSGVVGGFLGPVADVVDVWREARSGTGRASNLDEAGKSQFKLGAAGLVVFALNIAAARHKHGGFNEAFLEEVVPSQEQLVTAGLIGGGIGASVVGLSAISTVAGTAAKRALPIAGWFLLAAEGGSAVGKIIAKEISDQLTNGTPPEQQLEDLQRIINSLSWVDYFNPFNWFVGNADSTTPGPRVIDPFKFKAAAIGIGDVVAAAISDEQNAGLAVGTGTSQLLGSELDDELIHSGPGKAFGLGGDDLLVGWFPDAILPGDPLNPAQLARACIYGR